MKLDTKIVYLLLGSNLGDREGLIIDALERIQQEIGELVSKSSRYETAAWGKEDQPSFLNIAVGVATKLSPLEVLDKALAIELELGRVRKEKWGARLIDIDVILYGNEIVDEADKLQIPHPRMQERRFVLEPLAEIAGKLIHPVFQRSIAEILAELNDNLTVSKIV